MIDAIMWAREIHRPRREIGRVAFAWARWPAARTGRRAEVLMRLNCVVSSWVSGGLLLGACAQPTDPSAGYPGDDAGGTAAQTATRNQSGSVDGSSPAVVEDTSTTPSSRMPDASGGRTDRAPALDGGAAADRGAAADNGAAVDADASSLSTDATSTDGTDASTPGTEDAQIASADVAPNASTDAAAGQAPTIGGCPIFPADNPWNTRIDDPQRFPVHPNSATYIAKMSPGTSLHPDWGAWSTDHYGVPWQTVPASQPGVPMTFTYASESDPGPYPFPPNARIEGGAGSGGDMHVLVIETGSCTLYETWNSTYTNPGWSCGSGAKFDLQSNALRPDGWTSADAAGLPVLAGLVRVAEVQAGAINHALRFTVASTQQAYIHPATHSAGTADASLPPMGLRLRLKASYDLSTFTGPALVILTAMKQYGLMLADNGSNWFVTGDSDDAWTPMMSNLSQAFGRVHGSDFEAVDTGPIQ